MAKEPPTEFARDNRSHVINGLRKQKSRTRRGREIAGHFTLLDDERRKYFGNGNDMPGTIFAFKHLRKSALTAASNDPTVPDRQINLLAGHSAGISDKYVLRQATNKRVVACCEAIEEHFFGEEKAGPSV